MSRSLVRVLMCSVGLTLTCIGTASLSRQEAMTPVIPIAIGCALIALAVTKNED